MSLRRAFASVAWRLAGSIADGSGRLTGPHSSPNLLIRCVALLLLALSVLLPFGVHAASGDDGAVGAAAPAVDQWFGRDLSLGCLTRTGAPVRCGRDNGPTIHIYYGNADGGAGSPDALAFIRFVDDPSGNGEQLAVALFHQFRPGADYRLVKRLPPAQVGDVAPGTLVRFERGRAIWTMLSLQSDDSRSMPTGRKQTSVSLR